MWDSLSSSNGQADGRAYQDGSGWTVSTGSSKASGGDRVQTQSEPSGLFSQPAIVTSAGTMNYTGLAIAGVGVLVLVLLLKKRKK